MSILLFSDMGDVLASSTKLFLDFPSLSTVSILVTTGYSISYKSPPDFPKFSLGASYLLGNGPMMLDEMVLVLGLLRPVNSIISSNF